MRITVGCPIRERAWIFPEWLRHVDRAFKVIDIEPEFIFVLGRSQDCTEELVTTLAVRRPVYVQHITEENDYPKRRNWTQSRLEDMVNIRNVLLELVRMSKPDLFLSLDSDILLHPDIMPNLLETVQAYDAVGGKAYMARGISCPSFFQKTIHGNFKRKDFEGVTSVDVIMAIKLMTPAVYSIDYKFDPRGEDVGWSANVKEAGLSLGWDGRVANKHVMKEENLTVYDPRVGY